MIVGNYASTPDSIITYPELFVRWLDKSIEKEYKTLLKPDEIDELHEIHQYWQSIAVHGSERQLLPEDILPYLYYQNYITGKPLFPEFPGVRPVSQGNYQCLSSCELYNLFPEFLM